MASYREPESWSNNVGLSEVQQPAAAAATSRAAASFNLEPFALANPQLQDQPGLDHLFAALHNTSDNSMTLQLDHLEVAGPQHSYDSEASCEDRQHRSMSSDADPAAKKARVSGPASAPQAVEVNTKSSNSMCMHTACHRHAMYGFQGVPRFCSFHKEQVRQVYLHRSQVLSANSCIMSAVDCILTCTDEACAAACSALLLQPLNKNVLCA
jgi:hypothetical protein